MHIMGRVVEKVTVAEPVEARGNEGNGVTKVTG